MLSHSLNWNTVPNQSPRKGPNIYICSVLTYINMSCTECKLKTKQKNKNENETFSHKLQTLLSSEDLVVQSLVQSEHNDDLMMSGVVVKLSLGSSDASPDHEPLPGVLPTLLRSCALKLQCGKT